MMDPSRKRAGLTMIELIVTLSLIGVLVSLLLTGVMAARGSSDRIACANNLRQIGIALHNYHGVHGCLPPKPYRNVNDPNGVLGWMALILPEMDQAPAYTDAVAAVGLDTDAHHNPPHSGLMLVVRSYSCPSDARLKGPLETKYGYMATFTSYIGNEGANKQIGGNAQLGVLGNGLGIPLSMVTDGLSNTLMVEERPPPGSLQAGTWYPTGRVIGPGFQYPNNGMYLGGVTYFSTDPCNDLTGTIGPGRLENPCDRFHIWSLHRGGANVLFADGSAKFLRNSMGRVILDLATRAGGESVSVDD